MTVVRNDDMSPLFMAAIEATEEAILNSLFHAETMIGRGHHKVFALPVDKVLHIMQQRGYPIVMDAAATPAKAATTR